MRLVTMAASAVLLIAGIIVATAQSTFTVTTTSDSGDGSLRSAIVSNNANPPGTNTIGFNITGTGLQTIQPSNPLPTITVPVLIDGYSQSGAVTNGQTNGSNAETGLC